MCTKKTEASYICLISRLLAQMYSIIKILCIFSARTSREIKTLFSHPCRRFDRPSARSLHDITLLSFGQVGDPSPCASDYPHRWTVFELNPYSNLLVSSYDNNKNLMVGHQENCNLSCLAEHLKRPK